MVRESNPNQLEFAAPALGVTVDEFGGHDLRRLEYLGQSR
jgi:hypothetical protein